MWIKLHRKLLRWDYFRDPEMVQLFIWMLLKANHEPTVFRGHEIPRGSFVFGRDMAKRELGLSHSKIRNRLTNLQNDQQITIKTTNKFSVVTLVNWEEYQDGKDKITSKTTNKLTNKPPSKRPHIKKRRREEEKNINIIPSLNDFLEYAKEKKPDVDLTVVKMKFESWKENEWKDGNDRPIKNWKSKLLNTLPYLPETKNESTALSFGGHEN